MQWYKYSASFLHNFDKEVLQLQSVSVNILNSLSLSAGLCIHLCCLMPPIETSKSQKNVFFTHSNLEAKVSPESMRKPLTRKSPWSLCNYYPKNHPFFVDMSLPDCMLALKICSMKFRHKFVPNYNKKYSRNKSM